MNTLTLAGNIIDVINRKIFPGTLTVQNGKIARIKKEEEKQYSQYILPGFIDSHVHVESSMLIPSEFARLAVVHGTVATISDPHEIGNVLGIPGIRYMIENGSLVPFHFYFGASSCVPATQFETAGATISASDIRLLFEKDRLKYLSEMMNYPGVLARDSLVMEKIKVAQDFNLPVDGHAPGLRGEEAKRYISAGISTDHECFTLPEALDKLNNGMKILIREGSAAKNYEALHPLIKSHPDKVMFCSDDKHPHELVEGHINQIVKRSIIDKGYDLMDVLRCTSYNPIMHYHLDVGLLRENDPADFIIVDNLKEFSVKQNYIQGRLVAEKGKTLINSHKAKIVNHFKTHLKEVEDFKLSPQGNQIQVIQAIEGQLVTKKLILPAKIENENVISDPSRDILKLVVVNRYGNTPPAIGFINSFGLKRGAIGSSIAHDSHNIIAVGVDDEDICNAVNAIIQAKGGISVADKDVKEVLPLPVAGIMSNEDGYLIAEQYSKIDALAKKLGSNLNAPFMTLSFMALLVIPSLKLSDRGLFDGETFQFTKVFI